MGRVSNNARIIMRHQNEWRSCTLGQAEGFEIVGKSARKAKGSIGLKGKRGLKTFFVHGISK